MKKVLNTPGAFQSRLSFENIQWETSEQINIGAELGLFSNRLQMTLDWYKKSTIDWLIEAPVLASAGTNPPVINGGRVENTGVELELNYTQVLGELQLSFAGNGAFNKNQVKSIPTEDERIIGGGKTSFMKMHPHFMWPRQGDPSATFGDMRPGGSFKIRKLYRTIPTLMDR